MGGRHHAGSERCREIFARLSEYLDEELDPEVCAAIEEHNADCAPCLAFLASLRGTIDLLGDPAPHSLPDEARRSILAEYETLRARLDQDPGESG